MYSFSEEKEVQNGLFYHFIYKILVVNWSNMLHREYSCGRGNFPDWSIIIVHSNFKKNQEESLKDLARFFKEYMPRYGYKYICTEDDDYKYYQTLGLKCIMDGFCPNYAIALKDLNV